MNKANHWHLLSVTPVLLAAVTHIAKNFLAEKINAKVPLILGESWKEPLHRLVPGYSVRLAQER
jgi:hypothetical protein